VGALTGAVKVGDDDRVRARRGPRFLFAGWEETGRKGAGGAPVGTVRQGLFGGDQGSSKLIQKVGAALANNVGDVVWGKRRCGGVGNTKKNWDFGGGDRIVGVAVWRGRLEFRGRGFPTRFFSCFDGFFVCPNWQGNVKAFVGVQWNLPKVGAGGSVVNQAGGGGGTEPCRRRFVGGNFLFPLPGV